MHANTVASQPALPATDTAPVPGLPLPELARAITAGAVRLAAATAAWLALVAEFDSRGGWHGVGIKSCAHWLSGQCGLAPGPAREHLRVAAPCPPSPGSRPRSPPAASPTPRSAR